MIATYLHAYGLVLLFIAARPMLTAVLGIMLGRG